MQFGFKIMKRNLPHNRIQHVFDLCPPAIAAAIRHWFGYQQAGERPAFRQKPTLFQARVSGVSDIK
jgi:hypothetical protein